MLLQWVTLAETKRWKNIIKIIKKRKKDYKKIDKKESIEKIDCHINLPEEEKEKKRNYGRNHSKNPSNNKKRKE